MSFFGGRKHPENESSGFPPPPASGAGRLVGFETVLGVTATLRGDLKSQANVRLDGTFEGTLQIDGNVLVGEKAKITADIHAKNVSIAGAVRGNVSGKRVELLRTARVWGDITAAAIATEEGAFIDGKISMITHEAARLFDAGALPTPDELDLPDAAIPVEPPLALPAEAREASAAPPDEAAAPDTAE